MRIKIEVQSALGKFILPQGYNSYVQGLINACIPEDVAWPGASAGVEEARFKLFTFSQLYAKSVERIDVAAAQTSGEETRHIRYQLVFSSPVWFYLSSPSDEFVEALSRQLERAHDLHLEHNLIEKVNVLQVRTPSLPSHGPVTWRIRTISPITVYQSDGKDNTSTRYFAPGDAPFAPIVLENAIRKYFAWTQEKALTSGFSITCLDRMPHLAIVTFKDTPVRGYIGRFEITGDAALLSFLYNTGLGGKNSHGFGMFDIMSGDENGLHRREEENRRSDTGREAGSERPHQEAGVSRREDAHQRDHTEHRDFRSQGREHEGGSHWDHSGSNDHRTTRGGREDRFAGQKSHSFRRSDSSPRSSGRAGSQQDHGTRRGGEENHRKFVSRYAPDIRPVSRERTNNGSYSVWDGKPKTELPRFVRPDGTESTGGPRPFEHRGGGQRSNAAGHVQHDRDEQHGFDHRGSGRTPGKPYAHGERTGFHGRRDRKDGFHGA